jgi:hypothetical protein
MDQVTKLCFIDTETTSLLLGDTDRLMEAMLALDMTGNAFIEPPKPRRRSLWSWIYTRR